MKYSITIRDAAPDESERLSDLALRSKAHWGYSPEFLRLCVDELTVQPEQFENDQYYVAVAERDGEVVGFYTLARLSASTFELDALFVEPCHIGSGVGRSLIKHAQSTVSARAGSSLLIQGDPNAEQFYLAMGAQLIGSRESQSVPGRHLPLFEIALDTMEHIRK